jgi:hypothetical protein
VAQPTKSLQDTLRELWELLQAYARQETVGPLKNLGRQIGYGLAGSVLVAFGVFFVVLGVMRGLETHTPPLIGSFFLDHTWLIYLVAVAMLSLACVLAILKARSSVAAAASDTTRNSPFPEGSKR